MESPITYDLTHVPTSVLARELRMRQPADAQAHRTVLKTCKFCTQQYGTRQLMLHKRVCVKNPRVIRKLERQQHNGDN